MLPLFDAEKLLQEFLPAHAQDDYLIRIMHAIGETRCKRILSSLQTFFNMRMLNGVKLIPLRGGKTTTINIKVICGREEFVLRFIDQTFVFDRQKNEITCLEAASIAGIAPKVYFRDYFPDGAVVIMQFIPGKNLQIEDLQDKNKFHRLIKAIKKIHCLPPSFPANFTILDALINEMLLFEINRWLTPKAFLVMETLEVLKKRLVNIPSALVTSHWDLNPRNIYVNKGNIVFIDWGLARMENKYFDLGYLSTACYFNSLQDEEMLHLYLEREVEEKDKAYLYLYKTLAYACIGTYFYKSFFFHGGKDLKESSEMSLEALACLHAFESDEGTAELAQEIIIATYNQFLKNTYSDTMNEALRMIAR